MKNNRKIEFIFVRVDFFYLKKRFLKYFSYVCILCLFFKNFKFFCFLIDI